MHYQQHLTQLITPTFLNYFLHLAHPKKHSLLFFLLLEWPILSLPCWFSAPQIVTTETLYKSGLGSPLLSSLLNQFLGLKYYLYTGDCPAWTFPLNSRLTTTWMSRRHCKPTPDLPPPNLFHL